MASGIATPDLGSGDADEAPAGGCPCKGQGLYGLVNP